MQPAQTDDNVTNKKRYYISNLTKQPTKINFVIHEHWSLDVTFNEDNSRIRKRSK